MAAAGAIGGTLASAVDASPAAAGTDGDVVLSADNPAGEFRTAIVGTIGATEIAGFFNDAQTGAGVRGRGGEDATAFPWSTQRTDNSYGVFGESKTGVGVGAYSDSGFGLFAGVDTGKAVSAHGNSGIGVEATATSGMAVSASANSGIGVLATAFGPSPALSATNSDISNFTSVHAGPAISAQVTRIAGTPLANGLNVVNQGTGVGIDASDGGVNLGTGSALRAHLENPSNPAAAIRATTAGTGNALVATTSAASNTRAAISAVSNGMGAALNATATANATNPTVVASSASAQPAVRAVGKGVPVSGSVPLAGNAAALGVQGVATFTRSGVANVPAGSSSVQVNVPGGLSAASHVLATMQTATGVTIAVKSATPNAGTGKITIALTANAPGGGVQVAWFVFG
jgi:hypothetical protein